ncbi:SCY1-like protein 2 isoform X2 [Procambarus clarkii]|nr:SCY1-like protein 2 isoform X2 [Procambarus clarkii]XP_045584451.1 SCY1-like protein 2 isoform X2 [Procambarus clarkii]XP_045584452.1 SCY1-like protein 2 isoform X2 [Procambarus clarkii]
MELMLSKLRSSVSSAATSAVSNAVQIASQVSNYLPGNPVTREFEATAHIASAGPGLVWKVYKGYKKSTKQEAAIFVFEKRQVDKWDKQERESMLEKLRKGVSQLTRLRHPQVLTVQHPLEESRETLAFATEPVFASLANVLGNTDNMPAPPPPTLKNYKLYDVEIKYGLMQVSEGLAFLHNSVKIVHCNVCPENVVLNHQGAWKLFGFDFCVANQAAADQSPFWPFEEYDPRRHPNCQPHLDYLAPEYALTHTLDTAADLFPLGVIIYALFNEGRPIFHNNQDFATFKRNCCELKNTNSLNLLSIPDGLRDQVRLLLHATPQLRPDAMQFSKISYFEDVGVKTLSYLDQMFQWDNMQKSRFYKSLPQIIPQIPHRVCVLRIVPCLMKECINVTMVPFVLPVILLVAENASKEEFVEHILPHLKPIMKLSEPVQIMLQLMQKMELLLSKTPAEDVRSDVLPLLYRALECDTQQIQELCLSVIPSCAQLVENHAMKNALLPKIKKLCLGTGYLSVRVNCLVCVGKILEHLDKWLVMDDIFPFLEQIPSRESPVVMAIVGIFKVALNHKKLGITKEVLATKVLPFLFPLSIENSLTPSQHSAIMTLIKEMTDIVEAEHRIKLEQLNSIKVEQNALQMAMPTSISGSNSTSNGSVVSAVDATTDMFSELGLNSFMKRESGTSPKPHNLVPSSHPKPDVVPLTLEDKQKLVKEQGLRSTHQQQPPLLPSPPAPSSSINKLSENPNIRSQIPTLSPTSQASNNLTSSLMNSNLNMMTSQPAQPMLTSPNFTLGVNSTAGNSSFGLGLMNNINNSSMTYGVRSGGATALPSSGSMLQPNSGINSWANQAPSQSARMQTPNFSALDNLLPSQPKLGSMNQITYNTAMNPIGHPRVASSVNTFGSMMSPMQPLTTSSYSAASQPGVKPLSSSDINDFLS